jgi:hypothetical protein
MTEVWTYTGRKGIKKWSFAELCKSIGKRKKKVHAEIAGTYCRNLIHNLG